MGLSVGDITFDHRRHLAAKTNSGSVEKAYNSEMVISQPNINVVLNSMVASVYDIHQTVTLLTFLLHSANYDLTKTKNLEFIVMCLIANIHAVHLKLKL